MTVIPEGYIITDKCCDKTRFYDTFEDFPETGLTSRLYIDKSTGDIYIWDGDSYITAGGGGGIPYELLSEYNTHEEATLDSGLIAGSFYVLTITNLEGTPSAGQAGPFFRKN